MELTSIVGILVGLTAVGGAMVFKHIPFSALANPAAIFVIFVGTVATILNSYPGRDLKDIGKLFGILFTKSKAGGNEQKIIDMIVSLAEDSRKEGLLSLEGRLATIDDPFMRKALQMIIDGTESSYVLETLTAEIDAMRDRHNNNAGIFTSAGTYAPTLGVLGAVFGLIAAMSHIDEIEMMAEAVAAAFMATIFGIFTGYVLWNPFAMKLKTKSKHEQFEKMLIVEGILSISKGEPPVRIKEKLLSMMPSSEQEKLAKAAAE